MPPKAFSLGDYKAILISNEKEYHSSKGNKRQQVLEEVIEAITSDQKYKFKGTMEELQQVSQGIYQLGPNGLMHLNPEN